MGILKVAIDWAKDEVFSSWMFILFGSLFLGGAIGFWQLGKTDLAKAFVLPMLIAGGLLMIAGVSFYFSNKTRVNSFKTEYQSNPTEFIKSEIVRTEKTMHDYESIAFKVFPIVIAGIALLFIFIQVPIWRAICSITLVFLLVIVLIDSHAHARIENYHQQLIQESKT